MGCRIEVGALSHVGRVRARNEDSFAVVLPPDAPPGACGLAIVADGMGGHRAGDRASKLAIAAFTEFVAARTAPDPSGHPEQRSFERLMRDAMLAANRRVHSAASTSETRGMGTTLVAALIESDRVTLANVGDSRAYLSRKGALRQVTNDHSWVAEAVAQGMLTPRQAARHPYRNVITRAVGTAAEVAPDVTQEPLRADDVLLLCSDGLHGEISDAEIAEAIDPRAPEKSASLLVDAALAAGGHDNVTVIVTRLVRSEAPPGR